jgi:5'-phosphate synthase pdxT subunit
MRWICAPAWKIFPDDFGTAPGQFLLADSCDDPRVNTLHRTPLRILRNAYGRQIESFIDNINLQFAPETLQSVFIRRRN